MKVSEVLLYYKGKASNERTTLYLKVIRYLFYEMFNFMIMKVIIFYEKKFMKKIFVIL